MGLKRRWGFTGQDGGKINVRSLETKFRRQLTRLGIQNANLRTWRHTFAGYLMMRTGNIRAVQMLLGHKSIRTTETYSHLSERHLHHVVGQLPGPKIGTPWAQFLLKMDYLEFIARVTSHIPDKGQGMWFLTTFNKICCGGFHRII